MSKEHRLKYVIFVVTNCLTAPHVNIFAFNKDKDHWESISGGILEIEEVVSARMTCTSP